MPPTTNAVLLRQQLLIDKHVQGSLLRRAALYSSACGIYFMVILIFTEAMSAPNQSLRDVVYGCFDEAIYWAPGLILLAPLVAYDLLTFSNRFTGPIFRLRREMQRLIAGESIHPLSFRDDDYWTEMADIFNQIRGELQELRQFKAEAVAQNPDLRNRLAPQKLFNDDDQDVEDDFLTAAVGKRS